MAKNPLAPSLVPKRWFKNSWEDKAKENPLFAVMTTSNYRGSDTRSFSDEELAVFFDKGRRVYAKIIKPRLKNARTGAEKPFLVEYGCGMGRILKAVVEDGLRAGGVDISPTMIEHCKRLVPEAVDVHALDANNTSPLPDACADAVFSFAVMKHIHTLELYDAALKEMTRILKPGGVLILNVNSQDFAHGSFDNPTRTEHFPKLSKHYRAGEKRPFLTRKYSTWSGVYIGYDRLVATLAKGGLEVIERFHHTLKKPQGIWVVARKGDVGG